MKKLQQIQKKGEGEEAGKQTLEAKEGEVQPRQHESSAMSTRVVSIKVTYFETGIQERENDR